MTTLSKNSYLCKKKTTTMEAPKKSMAELKIDIVEVIVNSPVGIDKPVGELIDLFQKSADFVFSYNPVKKPGCNGL